MTPETTTVGLISNSEHQSKHSRPLRKWCWEDTSCCHNKPNLPFTHLRLTFDLPGTYLHLPIFPSSHLPIFRAKMWCQTSAACSFTASPGTYDAAVGRTSTQDSNSDADVKWLASNRLKMFGEFKGDCLAQFVIVFLIWGCNCFFEASIYFCTSPPLLCSAPQERTTGDDVLLLLGSFKQRKRLWTFSIPQIPKIILLCVCASAFSPQACCHALGSSMSPRTGHTLLHGKSSIGRNTHATCPS